MLDAMRCDEYEYAKGLSMYAHKAIQKHVKAQRKSYKDNSALQRAKIEVFADLDDLHQRNARRKTQVTTKKAARIHSIGVTDMAKKHEEITPVIIKTPVVEEATDDWEVW